MGRPLRVDVGGYVYHALNRASAQATLFEQPADYQAVRGDAGGSPARASECACSPIA